MGSVPSSSPTADSPTDPAAIARRLIEAAEGLEREIITARARLERKGQRSEMARAARAARRVIYALQSVVPARRLKRVGLTSSPVGT
jgi:hypothetical protein